MKPTVFVHAKKQYLITAKVAEFSLKIASKSPNDFETQILFLEDFPHLTSKQGQKYKRPPGIVKWKNEDPQAFCPLRFLPPQLMGYQGRAVVMDADIFALGDIYELLSSDMKGKAIYCKRKEYAGGKKRRRGHFVSSVMLLDCVKLKHWKWQEMVDRMFAMELNWQAWMNLQHEDLESIGILEDQWNQYDELTKSTKLLHNTNRSTQPWMTGLPYNRITYGHHNRIFGAVPRHWFTGLNYWLKGEGYLPYGKYQQHPDINQQNLFFSILKKAIQQEFISKSLLENEISKGHIRADAFELMSQLSDFNPFQPSK